MACVKDSRYQALSPHQSRVLPGRTMHCVRFAMLPADEAVSVELLTSEWDLSLLASDVLVSGAPEVITDVPAALPKDLPPRDRGPGVLVFWRESWGVNLLAPDSTTTGQVASLLTSEHTDRVGAPDAELLDTARTPVIRLRRSRWSDDGALVPAALQAMSVPTSRQPEDLMLLYQQIERRFQRMSTRVDVSSQTSDRYRPAIYAMPAAAAWIGRGGLVYPWG